MRTTKPISTISYNTSEFLENMLNELIKAHKVAFWCYIEHIGEALEDGTIEKNHKHVYIEPNVKIDTMDLQDMSKELDPLKPDKPLKCVEFRPSKWVDWVWYTLHDVWYLSTKFETKQYSYTKQDYKYSDEAEFEERYNRAIHSSDIHQQQALLEALGRYTAGQLAMMGMVKPQQAIQLAAFENLLNKGRSHVAYEKEIEDRIKKLEELEKNAGFREVEENPFEEIE